LSIKCYVFYKSKASKGSVSVRYAFTIPDFGRVYASGKYISMGNFPREIRATLAKDNYVDIDVNNCHPVLAVQLCDKFSIPCDELRGYVNNREDYLKKCMEEFECERDNAKVLFLQIMYGGSYSSWAKNNGVDKMAIEFNSVEELYKRVRPALTSKVREFRRNKKDFVKEEDVWNYLIESKWRNGKGLELYNLVDDILNTNNKEIEDYVINKLKGLEREVHFDKIDLT